MSKQPTPPGGALAADETADLPALPSWLGPFRLDVVLGRGGMGEVFLAWDRRLERRVAIKKIRRQKAAEAEVHRQRLLREARAGARLGHPSIVQVFDIVELDGFDWIVMEYVDGPTIDQLARNGPLDLDLAISLGRQVAEGLVEAHGKGLLHRDLKSENVMVDHEGRAKILDFGLAKRLELMADGQLTSVASLTQSGEVMGTCRSMSPEQAKGLDLDGRSDLFSLGVLLYEMVTGISPFRADTPVATLSLVVHHHQASAQSLNPEVPRELSDYIDRLLEKEPAGRPRNANKVVRDLRRLAGELGVQSSPIGLATVTPFPEHRARPPARPPLPAPPQPLPWASRHAGRAALAVLALTAVAALAVYRESWWPAPSAPEASARRAIAVLEIANLAPAAETDWLATALRILVADELAKVPELRVLADEEVGRTRSELGLAPAQNLAADTLSRLRSGLGADLVVLGSYRLDPASRRLMVLLDLQDTTSGEIRTFRQELDGDDLLASAGKLGDALRAGLGAGDPAAEAGGPERLHLAEVLLRAGRYREALDQLAELRKSGSLDPRHQRLEAQAWQGAADQALREGNFGAARDHGRLALAQARAGGFAHLGAATQLTLAKVALASGELAEAGKLLDDGDIQAATLGDRPLQGLFRLTRGELAERQGDLALARRCFEEARELLPDHNGPAAGLARLRSR